MVSCKRQGAPRRASERLARGQDDPSIYLPEQEFAVLAASLQGARIRKLRHRLKAPPGVSMSVDEFQDELAGLVLIEAEFDTTEQRVAFAAPAFALREVTADLRYSGGQLVQHGLPRET